MTECLEVKSGSALHVFVCWMEHASHVCGSQQGAGGRIFGHKHFVLHPVNEEAVVLPVVGVVGVSQRHQLDGLTLLQDPAGGGEANQVVVDHL